MPKDIKDNLNLICFINAEIATHKLSNVSLKLDVDMFANLALDIDFVNLTEESAINFFLNIKLLNLLKLIYKQC